MTLCRLEAFHIWYEIETKNKCSNLGDMADEGQEAAEFIFNNLIVKYSSEMGTAKRASMHQAEFSWYSSWIDDGRCEVHT